MEENSAVSNVLKIIHVEGGVIIIKYLHTYLYDIDLKQILYTILGDIVVDAYLSFVSHQEADNAPVFGIVDI